MPELNFTPEQRAAIDTRGSTVLVSAAAGSGKTRVLTERLMAYLTDAEHPVDIDHFLVITYTRAAAAELRSRGFDVNLLLLTTPCTVTTDVQMLKRVTDVPLDVHLMIDRPVRYVEQFCDAGGDLITCHVEADTEENIHAAIDKIHAKGKKAGIVLKPKTTWEAVLPYIDQVELILVMTVEPGFGGQKFLSLIHI